MNNILGFYTTEEIVDAKNLLFQIAESCKTNSVTLPRNVPRVVTENQRIYVTKDIHDLWSCTDINKLDYPVFVAADLSRIPPLQYTDKDASGMAFIPMEVRAQVTSLDAKVGELTAQVKSQT